MKRSCLFAIYICLILYSNQSLSQNIFSDTRPETLLAHKYYSKAENFSTNAQYDSSNFYLEKASVIYKELGERENKIDMWEKYVHCINFIGNNLRKSGKLKEALDCLNKALEIGINKFGENHCEVASIYHNIGCVYLTDFDNETALDYLNRALKIRLQILGDNHIDVAESYNAIGVVHRRKWDLRKSLQYLRKSLAIKRSLIDENDVLIARSYNNIGNIYQSMSDFEKALEYHNKSMTIYTKSLIKNHPLIAECFSKMGRDFNGKGDFYKALEYYNKSLSIYMQIYGEKHAAVSYAYNEIGINYHRIRNYEKALEYYQKSLAIKLQVFGENHPMIPSSYNNIGRIYQEKGDYDNALKYYNKCLAIGLQIWGENNDGIATTFGNIGYLLFQKKEYEQAIAYLNKSNNLLLKIVHPNHENLILSFERLAEFYAEQNNFEKAFHYIQKSLIANAPDFNNMSMYTNPSTDHIVHNMEFLAILNRKANILKKYYLQTTHETRDLNMSYETYRLAISFIDKMRTSQKAEGSKLFLGEHTAEIYENAISTALELYEITGNAEYKDDAFLFAEKSKSRILLLSLQDIEARQFVDIPDSLLEMERELKIDLAYYDTQIQQEKQKQEGRDSLRIAEFENIFFDLNRQYEQLIEKFEVDHLEYYNLKYQIQTASVIDLQHYLDEKSALVNYFIGASSIYIFTIMKDSFEVTSLAIESSFVHLIEAFRTSIKADRKQRYIEIASKLYNVLIAPIADKISQKMKLVIIPHGNLFKIPFESLLMEEPKQNLWESLWKTDIDYSELAYLLKKHNISYHYSATLYLNGIQKSRKYPAQYSDSDDTFIGFAPVFGDQKEGSQLAEKDLFDTYLASLKEYFSVFTRDGKNLCELPFSQYELQTIINEFKKRNKKISEYIYDEASEENFKTKSGKSKYIHLATHSFINEDKPRFSGIAFFQSKDSTNKEIDDGILYASEIYNLNLNADLVVLSSCESGIGKLVQGEGIMAMTRGFLYAGARNIMLSLWKVNDRFTSQLMVDFYKEMLSGKRHAEALRAAKLRMIKNKKSAKPVLWSGFVLIGG